MLHRALTAYLAPEVGATATFGVELDRELSGKHEGMTRAYGLLSLVSLDWGF